MFGFGVDVVNGVDFGCYVGIGVGYGDGGGLVC